MLSTLSTEEHNTIAWHLCEIVRFKGKELVSAQTPPPFTNAFRPNRLRIRIAPLSCTGNFRSSRFLFRQSPQANQCVLIAPTACRDLRRPASEWS
jgi:hypothetical protein